MQVHQSSLKPDERPCPGRDCPECKGCALLHKHGEYRRWRGLEGEATETVQRYLCPRCGRTWSVIPQGMMPYRPIEVERFEKLTDAHLDSAGGDPRPPPATEKEAGCIRRAMKKLSERIPLLCGLLGQQMPSPFGLDIAAFWRALRKLGSTGRILLRLARDFKTSLLRCYRSHLPHWEREKAHAGLV
jgi:hypothetical protein